MLIWLFALLFSITLDKSEPTFDTLDLARTAIRAMHTPTTEMLRDVNLSATCSADDIAYMWETMIDAASPQEE